MSTEPQTETAHYGYQSDEQFQQILDELSKVKQEVADTQRWFQDHARTPRVLFRVSGILLILLSVSVPFIAAQTAPWKDTVVSIATLTIAGLSGLTAFFRWEYTWQGNRQTEYALEHLLTMWQLKMVEAKHVADTQQAISLAFQATEQLLLEARAVTSTETTEYFRHVQMPQVQAAGK